jgi:hypothetical protein
MLKSKAVILAKVETTYGTDATPAAGTNAILCEVPEFEVLGRKLDRANVKTYFGTLPPVNLGEGLKVSFTTELKGHGGAVDSPPEIGVLFRGCAFTETISAGTSVAYDPNSSEDGESLTLYFYQHDILHKLLGARGTFSVEMKAGDYAKIKWEFTGLYAGPADDSIPTGTFNSTKPPRFVSASFAIDSYAAVIENLKVDVNNEIAKRVSANHATGISEYLIRERAVSGECDPEAVTLATKDFWTMWSSSTPVALTATVGTASKNKCVISAPAVVPDIPKYGDREGILTYALPLIFTPSSGDDEIQFLFN